MIFFFGVATLMEAGPVRIAPVACCSGPDTLADTVSRPGRLEDLSVGMRGSCCFMTVTGEKCRADEVLRSP
jgi:hypothetical protein